MRRLRILCAGLMLIGSALTVKGQTAEAPPCIRETDG